MTSLVVLLCLIGADTPLSAVLIEGEGWKEDKDTLLDIGLPEWSVAKDGSIRRSTLKGVVFAEGPALVWPKKGETFGPCAVSPGGGKLVVAVPSHHHLYVFRIGADGKLSAQEKCYVLRKEKPGRGGSGVSSLAFDSKGRLWAAVPEGVAYFDEEMRFSGMLSRPVRAEVTHLLGFGGEKGDELFILCGGKRWKRKVKATGAKPAG
ncbi:MAG: hypothetical protein K2W96_16975 [Gemmataceae bacterium]|nr:hypothetical protein [Gemmataceae bacterium]